MEEYLTARDIMRIMKVSRPQAYSYLHGGKLKTYKVGRLVRIKPADLKQFIEGKPSKNKSR
jgi:excisionase family DNA binding protein